MIVCNRTVADSVQARLRTNPRQVVQFTISPSSNSAEEAMDDGEEGKEGEEYSEEDARLVKAYLYMRANSLSSISVNGENVIAGVMRLGGSERWKTENSVRSRLQRLKKGKPGCWEREETLAEQDPVGYFREIVSV